MIISRKGWLISKGLVKALKEARIANDAKAEFLPENPMISDSDQWHHGYAGY